MHSIHYLHERVENRAPCVTIKELLIYEIKRNARQGLEHGCCKFVPFAKRYDTTVIEIKNKRQFPLQKRLTQASDAKTERDYIIIFGIPVITASIDISKGTEANDGERSGSIEDGRL